MKAQAHTKLIAKLIKLAKQSDDFSEFKKQEIFLCIKEAKTRGLLRKQARDRCLSEYINAANYLLRVPTDELENLTQELEYLYVYIALISNNLVTVTA
jgi:hypothetical protein